MEDISRSIATLNEINQHTVGRHQIYIVGGLIRDLYYKLPAAWNDIDLVSPTPARKLAIELSNLFAGSYQEFPQFLTAKVSSPKLSSDLDLVTCRSERYEMPGALPLVQAGTFEADIWRRDFSINSLAVSLADFCAWAADGNAFEQLKEKIIDLVGGLEDLQQKRLRVLHDRSFIDDPTRIFRLARYLVRINGQMSDCTEDLLHSALASEVLKTISNYRKVSELKRIIQEPSAGMVIKQLLSWDFFLAEDLLDRESQAVLWQNLENFETIPLSQRWPAFLQLLFLMQGNAIADERVKKFFNISKKQQGFFLSNRETLKKIKNPKMSIELTRLFHNLQ